MYIAQASSEILAWNRALNHDENQQFDLLVQDESLRLMTDSLPPMELFDKVKVGEEEVHPSYKALPASHSASSLTKVSSGQRTVPKL